MFQPLFYNILPVEVTKVTPGEQVYVSDKNHVIYGAVSYNKISSRTIFTRIKTFSGSSKTRRQIVVGKAGKETTRQPILPKR